MDHQWLPVVGDWRLKGHLLDKDRLLVQTEVRSSIWVNIAIERTTDTTDTVGDWRLLILDWFLHPRQQTTTDTQASQKLLTGILDWCDERYKTALPQFGSTLFLESIDSCGRISMIEAMDPNMVDALPTADALFDSQDIPIPVVSRPDLHVQVVDGTFFPQTRPVSYHGKTFVAKGPASAARALDDLREAVILSRLQLQHPHPNLLAPPTALIRLSDDDGRICGFLIPFYENGNLDSYARKLRRHGRLTSDVLWSWARQMLSVTKFLIDAGTGHGDIKPDNILVNSDEEIVLIDLARKYTTTCIASPEVMKGKSRSKLAAKESGILGVPADWPSEAIEKSEIYSIGRTLFLVSEGIAMEDIYMNPGTVEASQTSFVEQSPTPAELQNFILACVKEDASQRLSLTELATYYRL